MSEHRSSRERAAIIRFPFPEDENEDWSPEIINEWTERARHLRAYIESGHLLSDTLLEVERESFEMLTIYWAGLPPSKADALVERLAPGWAKFTALMTRNCEKATAQLAKRGERTWQ